MTLVLDSMPFFANYWSYFLGGIVLYAIFYLSSSTARKPSFAEQRKQEVKEEKRSRRREAADDSEEEDLEADSAPVSDPNENVEFVPYQGKEYDEV